MAETYDLVPYPTEIVLSQARRKRSASEIADIDKWFEQWDQLLFEALCSYDLDRNLSNG